MPSTPFTAHQRRRRRLEERAQRSDGLADAASPSVELGELFWERSSLDRLLRLGLLRLVPPEWHRGPASNGVHDDLTGRLENGRSGLEPPYDLTRCPIAITLCSSASRRRQCESALVKLCCCDCRNNIKARNPMQEESTAGRRESYR